MGGALSRLVALGAVTALVWGCGPGRAERIAAQRARYQATVNGWVVEQKPGSQNPGGQSVEQSIALDVQLSHDSPEALAGITLDVSHRGADKKEKRHLREWVDVAGLAAGDSRQVTLHLDGSGYSPGDLFRVEVREPVPAADRPLYREFSQPGRAPA
jgi:hypothetical protein